MCCVICVDRDDTENSRFYRPTTSLVVIGFFVKTVPTWIRLVHVFNCCQIGVWTIDLLILPDCNNAGLRWIVGELLALPRKLRCRAASHPFLKRRCFVFTCGTRLEDVVCICVCLLWPAAVTTFLWWAVVALGTRAKRKIVVPAYLYDPLRPGELP